MEAACANPKCENRRIRVEDNAKEFQTELLNGKEVTLKRYVWIHRSGRDIYLCGACNWAARIGAQL